MGYRCLGLKVVFSHGMFDCGEMTGGKSLVCYSSLICSPSYACCGGMNSRRLKYVAPGEYAYFVMICQE